MVMAKGVEDCAFYRWSRLTSLNEVGGDPSVFARDAGRVPRLGRRPAARVARRDDRLSTHDTKRGEDVRARITVLAEMPGVWEARARPAARARAAAGPGLRQPALAGRRRRLAGAGPGPAGPAARVRREGDARGRRPDHRGPRPTRTTRRPCTRPSTPPSTTRGSRRWSRTWWPRTAGPGWSNALAAKLLALTMPGVPDVYQGSELWEQSLVDPDNRRPVDFDRRAALLEARPTARSPRRTTTRARRSSRSPARR